jgi:hypothetical protein
MCSKKMASGNNFIVPLNYKECKRKSVSRAPKAQKPNIATQAIIAAWLDT